MIIVNHVIAAIKESLLWRSVRQNETLYVGNFQKDHALPLRMLTLKNQLLELSLLELSLLEEVLCISCNNDTRQNKIQVKSF